jgi:hypothetical protein
MNVITIILAKIDQYDKYHIPLIKINLLIVIW